MPKPPISKSPELKSPNLLNKVIGSTNQVIELKAEVIYAIYL